MKKNLLIASTSIILISASLVFFLNSKPASAYTRFESLSKELQERSNVVSKELFNSFKASSEKDMLSVGGTFPQNLKILDIKGVPVIRHNKSSVIVIGDKDSGFAKYLEKYINSSDLEVVWMVPYGNLPIVNEANLHVVDARDNDKKGSWTGEVSSGKLAGWFGFTGSIGAYVIDKDGTVRFSVSHGHLIQELEDSIAQLRQNKPIEKGIHGLKLGKPVELPETVKFSKIYRDLINSKSGVSVVIVTNSDKKCDSCENLSMSMRKDISKWEKSGVNTVLLDIGATENGIKNGVQVIADPKGQILDNWGYQSLPQAIILNRGNYAGTVPYSELTFTKKATSGEVVERLTTRAPFSEGISKSVDFVKQKDRQ